MNIPQLRCETPGCQSLVHFNSAGAALNPNAVVDKCVEVLQRESVIGGYEAEEEYASELTDVYSSLSELLGASSEEIALSQSATQAWNQLFYGLNLAPGDRILTCRSEYASNMIAFLHRSMQCGAELVVVKNDSTGQICLEHLTSLLDERVKLVALNHMPTNSGLIQPASEIGTLLQGHPAFFLLDACQSVGQCPLDVKQIGCHGLSGTSRKYLRGPRGAGFLYLNKARLEELTPPMPDLHAARWEGQDHFRFRSDAKRFETYESSLAVRLGFGEAVRYAQRVGLEVSWARIQTLAGQLRDGLTSMKGVTLRDPGNHRSGIVTFSIAGSSARKLQLFLRERRINVSVCSKHSALLDMQDRGLEEVVRASCHYYNTEDELTLLLDALEHWVRKVSV